MQSDGLNRRDMVEKKMHESIERLERQRKKGGSSPPPSDEERVQFIKDLQRKPFETLAQKYIDGQIMRDDIELVGNLLVALLIEVLRKKK